MSRAEATPTVPIVPPTVPPTVLPTVVLHVRRLVLDAGMHGAASAHALRGPAFQAALQRAVSEAMGQHLQATGSAFEPASPAHPFVVSLAGSIAQAVAPHVAAASPGASP